jgi:hypothetical protein
MKTLFLSLFFVTGSILSNKGNNPVNLILQTDSTLLKKLKSEKATVDQYITKHGKNLIVLVKIPGKKDLVMVKNDSWPDQIEYTLNLLQNPEGKTIFLARMLDSESGDWMIMYKYYFDVQGNTYAFSEEESIFNDNVKGGMIGEKFLKYYDRDFKIISDYHGLTDMDGKIIIGNRDNFDFHDDKYTIYKNLNECRAVYNISSKN